MVYKGLGAKGFTIVELLIVITVIAVISSIVVVSLGSTRRSAENSQTIAAVSQWVKILNLHKADTGSFSTLQSCLGTGYGKGISGTDSTGGECRQDVANSGGLIVNPPFLEQMEPYMNGKTPTPAMITGGSVPYPWYRGAYYYPAYSNVKPRIDFILHGSDITCPSVGQAGTISAAGRFPETNTVRCVANLE